MACGRKPKPPLNEKDLTGFKYLRTMLPLFEKFHLLNEHHNRELHYDQYLSLILLYYFNPIITSLRGIQQASSLEKVQQQLGIKRTSLGSLSEAQHVFDAHVLAPVVSELAQKALPLEHDPRLKALEQTLTAVDATLLKALPKMLWAVWLDDQHRAAKLHLEFDICRWAPVSAEITAANANEKTYLKQTLAAHKCYVLDAGYSCYALLEAIIKARSCFVVRLRDTAVWDIIAERPLTPQDQKAGVLKDLVVQLGADQKQDDLSIPVRVIQVFHTGDSSRPRRSRVSSKKTFRTTESDYLLLLATDRMDLPAEIIALLFCYRWQIELFFRWFKCVLGCRHLLAHSIQGLTIQVYGALIASLLITLWTGCKPTKRTFEMLCFYFMGWATDKELAAHIEKLQQAVKHKTSQ
jgi:hypothetical protein